MIRISFAGIMFIMAGGSPLQAQKDLSGAGLQPGGAAIHTGFVSDKSTAPDGRKAETAPVPETLGATLLAGAGFLFMLRRRRFA